jgi:hypothetical protein
MPETSGVNTINRTTKSESSPLDNSKAEPLRPNKVHFEIVKNGKAIPVTGCGGP